MYDTVTLIDFKQDIVPQYRHITVLMMNMMMLMNDMTGKHNIIVEQKIKTMGLCLK